MNKNGRTIFRVSEGIDSFLYVSQTTDLKTQKVLLNLNMPLIVMELDEYITSLRNIQF